MPPQKNQFLNKSGEMHGTNRKNIATNFAAAMSKKSGTPACLGQEK
jgi:hypothetical protein